MFYTRYIREDKEIRRTPITFFESNRARPEQTFQETEDENGKPYYVGDVDVLLGKNREMGVDLT